MSVRSGMHLPPEFDRAAEQARLAGWTVSQHPKNHHVCWKPPGSAAIIYTSSTPSDHRANRNGLARLRRAGLDI